MAELAEDMVNRLRAVLYDGDLAPAPTYEVGDGDYYSITIEPRQVRVHVTVPCLRRLERRHADAGRRAHGVYMDQVFPTLTVVTADDVVIEFGGVVPLAGRSAEQALEAVGLGCYAQGEE